MKIVSWNLLRDVGATLDDVVALVEREKPDLLLMQEVTRPFEALQARLGGTYAWEPQPGRRHGLAMWSQVPFKTPVVSALMPGAWFERICQIVTIGEIGIANVHLSHGQRLNRQQLREIAHRLPLHAAVLGDFNLVGPAMLPGFRDVGPRWPTHRMVDIVPLRIDRCLVRGLRCDQRFVLPRQRSDHRPISVHLSRMPGEIPVRRSWLRYTAAAVGARRRAAVREGFAP